MNQPVTMAVFLFISLPEIKVFVYLPNFCPKRKEEQKNLRFKRNEKNVPAIQQEEEEQARFQRAHVECEREEDPCPKKSERQNQINRFFRTRPQEIICKTHIQKGVTFTGNTFFLT